MVFVAVTRETTVPIPAIPAERVTKGALSFAGSDSLWYRSSQTVYDTASSFLFPESCCELANGAGQCPITSAGFCSARQAALASLYGDTFPTSFFEAVLRNERSPHWGDLPYILPNMCCATTLSVSWKPYRSGSNNPCPSTLQRKLFACTPALIEGG